MPYRALSGDFDFDEGSAQVRRLLDRDRKETDFETLEKVFQDPDSAIDAASDTPAAKIDKPSKSTPPPPSKAPMPSSKTGASPFGGSSSPFGTTQTSTPFKSKFAEPPSMLEPENVEDEKPWWQSITLTQIVIVLSFTLIISSMIGTFFVVYNMGGIRFNE